MTPDQAKQELKRGLREEIARRVWSPADLARKAGVARNVVTAALNDGKGVPSAETLNRLLSAFGIVDGPRQMYWVELRNRAAAKPDGGGRSAVADVPGVVRPLAGWSPYMLGVHKAVSADSESETELPGFVARAHDDRLREILGRAVHDEQHVVAVLLGGSSTGKTRSALEAVRACLPDWPLLPPVDASGLREILRQWPVEKPVVLWLNETQRFLRGPGGVEAAAELRRRLSGPGRTVVLGTLWPMYWRRLTAAPKDEEPDEYAHARDLLNSAELIIVPEAFHEPAAIAALDRAARHDKRLAAAARATDGKVIQALTGGPDLLYRFEHVFDAYSRAIVSAAIDAQCLDVAEALPPAFLEAAAPAYLTGPERVTESTTWFAEALRQATTTKPTEIAALTPTRTAPGLGAADGYLLADYLAQHGRAARSAGPVPVEVSQALADHVVTAADRRPRARTAEQRGFYRFAAQLLRAEVEATGDARALRDLGRLLERKGDTAEAEKWLRAAVTAGDFLATTDLVNLLGRAGRIDDALDVLRGRAMAGDRSAKLTLGRLLADRGRTAEAERCLRAIIDAGDTAPTDFPSIDLIWTGAMYELAMLLEHDNRQQEADEMLRNAARHGSDDAARLLDERYPAAAVQRAKERLLGDAEAGDWDAMRSLRYRLEEAGEQEEADHWLRRAAEAGDLEAMVDLARDLRRAGRLSEAKQWLRDAVEAWNHPYPRCMVSLLETPPRPPDWRIERYELSTATIALTELGEILEDEGDDQAAERLWEAMDMFGDGRALKRLCHLLARRGDEKRAERLARARAEDGSTGSLHLLADLLTAHGRLAEAEAPLRYAARQGNDSARTKLIDLLRRLGRFPEAEHMDRYGLDPRGDTDGSW